MNSRKNSAATRPLLSIAMGLFVGAIIGFPFYELGEIWKPVILGVCYFLAIQAVLLISGDKINGTSRISVILLSALAGSVTGGIGVLFNLIPLSPALAVLGGGIMGLIYGFAESR